MSDRNEYQMAFFPYVENRNKHTWKRIERQVGYLQRYLQTLECVHKE